MKIYFLSKEKKNLALQVKKYEETSTSGSRNTKRRPGVEDVSVSIGDYPKALAHAEKRRLECLKFEVSSNKYKGQVRELEKQLKSARLDIDTKEDHMTRVIEENVRI